MTEKLHRILLVDDEPDILTVAEIALREIGGYEVMTCASGHTALEGISSFDPDLVVMDMMMPGMNGLQAFEQIRSLERLPNLPVIFMTAKVQPEEITEYLQAGAAGVIEKPFDPMTLPERVQLLWESVQDDDA